MDSEHDREYLEQLAAKIDALGVEVEHRSNLISIASRLHDLRTRETDPTDQERLDFELDAVMAVIESKEPHVPTSIDEHLNHADDLHRRMLDIFEGRGRPARQRPPRRRLMSALEAAGVVAFIALTVAAFWVVIGCGCAS